MSLDKKQDSTTELSESVNHAHAYNHEHGHHHHHAHSQNKSAKKRLIFMLTLTTTFFFVEISVGYVTNSMALVADSFHMLSDVIALIIAYVSVRMSPKKWSKNTFGWARAEVLGALVNAVFLCALCFSIFVESIKRFYSPETIHEVKLILGVGVFGLLVNLIGLFMFKDGGHHHGHSHGHFQADAESAIDVVVESMREQTELYQQHNDCPLERSSSPETDAAEPAAGNTLIEKSSRKSRQEQKNETDDKAKMSSSQQMNIRGVFLHILADALGSVIVCVSAVIVLVFPEWTWKDYVDPFLSILMVCLIMASTYPLLVESAMILLQTVPTHIQVDSLQKKLLQEIDGVLAVHEFHVWQLAGDRIIASAHIRCRNLHDYMQIAEKIKTFFHNKGIHSTTIQPEFMDPVEYDESKPDQHCMLDCPTKTTCVAQTCCGPQFKKGNGKDKAAETAVKSAAVTPAASSDASDDSMHVQPPLDTAIINLENIEKPGDANSK